MNKPDLSKMIRTVRTGVRKRSPEILTGIGIAGMISTTIMAVRATPKALKLLEEKRKAGNDQNEIGKLDAVKTTWKCYAPSFVTGAASVVCLIGAQSINMKRNAVLATAYTLSETALSEYRDKVVETVGEKKEQSIRDKVAKERLAKYPAQNTEVIVTGKGETLCLDLVSMRKFKSDIETIRKIENNLNKRLLNEMYISINEFYYELGLQPTKLGDHIGWNIEKGLISLSFSSQLDEDGTPCLVIDYDVAPRYDYRDLI